MKILVLGSNPSAKPQRKESTLQRLARWAEKLGIEYDFANVIPHHVAKERLDDVEFMRVYKMTLPYDKVLSLGNFVDSVLTQMKIVHYALPHPSPRNRQFNDPTFEEKTLQKLLDSGFLK